MGNCCDGQPNVFGQPVRTGVVFPIQRSPDDVLLPGVIGSTIDGVFTPTDLTSWRIQLPMYDDLGNLLFTFDSDDGSIIITPGVNQNPNFTLSVKNALFVVPFPQDGTFNCSFITTDSNGTVRTYWTGTAPLTSS